MQGAILKNKRKYSYKHDRQINDIPTHLLLINGIPTQWHTYSELGGAQAFPMAQVLQGKIKKNYPERFHNFM